MQHHRFTCVHIYHDLKDFFCATTPASEGIVDPHFAARRDASFIGCVMVLSKYHGLLGYSDEVSFTN